MKKSLIGLLLVTATLCAATQKYEGKLPCGLGRLPYRVDARHIETGGVGYNAGYSTFEGFVSMSGAPSRWNPFIEARAHVFDNGRWAANAGLGSRLIPKNFCSYFGGNLFYDYRHTLGRQMNQIGVGFEYATSLWEVRMNGYIPVGRKQTMLHNFQFEGMKGSDQFLFRATRKIAKYGLDLEAAETARIGDLRLVGALGAYSYFGGNGRDFFGGRGRIKAAWLDYFSFEVITTLDRVFHGRLQGELMFAMPLGPRAKIEKRPCTDECDVLREIDQKLMDRVQRQEIIVVEKVQRRIVVP